MRSNLISKFFGLALAVLLLLISGCGTKHPTSTSVVTPSVESKVESTIEVQNEKYKDEFNVQIDKSAYSKNDTLYLTITNKSSKTITTGEFLTIQKLENNKWYTLTLSHFAFPAIAYLIPPGGSHRFNVSIFKWLPTGTYRFITEITYEEDSKKITILISTPDFDLK